jgi:hypothetical protein
MTRATMRVSRIHASEGGAYGIRTPCRSQSGNGWTEAYCPHCWEAVAVLPSAVAVDGTDIGAELKRAQVTRYPSLRLPSSGRSTSTGFSMDSGK